MVPFWLLGLVPRVLLAGGLMARTRRAGGHGGSCPPPIGEVCLDGRWRTADVLGLVRAIRAKGSVHRLPILADALMEAGCDDPEWIWHCRVPCPHGTGCWVIDRLCR